MVDVDILPFKRSAQLSRSSREGDERLVMDALAAGDGNTALIAWLALGLSALNTIVGLTLWNRYVPRIQIAVTIKERLNRLDDSVVLDVRSVGRLAAVVRRVGLSQRVEVERRNGNKEWIEKSSSEIPSEEELPKTLPPTDFWTAEVPMRTLVELFGAGTNLFLVAWVELGSGSKVESRRIKVKVPRVTEGPGLVQPHTATRTDAS